jgi:hypothetical protein
MVYLWRCWTMRGVRACVMVCSLMVLWGSRYTVQAVLATSLWLMAVIAEHLDRERPDEPPRARHLRLIHRRRRRDSDGRVGGSRRPRTPPG